MSFTYHAMTGGGAWLRSDGAFVPNDPGNRDYKALQAHTAGGGSISAATPESFDAAIARGLGVVEAQAARERLRHLSTANGLDLVSSLRFREALDLATDDTPTSGEYPLLNAEVGVTANDLVNVGVAVRAELVSLKTPLAAIEAVRVAKRAAVIAAATPTAVDAILAAIVWPA